MTAVQDVVRRGNSGGPVTGRRVDSPRSSCTGEVVNHRNLSFRDPASTAQAAQLLPADLHSQRLSTESTAPTTTTKFQLIPRRATTGAFCPVWRTSRVAGCSPRLTRSRSNEMERNHL